MPQFPDWKRQAASLTDAAQLRQTQALDALADLAARGRQATESFTNRAADLARQTRDRGEQLQHSVVNEVRSRFNVLGLATKQDVESMSRLGRKRVSAVLHQFVETQHEHDEVLLESLRVELREELQSFAAAIDDDLFELDHEPVSQHSVAGPAEYDFDEDLVDDDFANANAIDLTSLDAILDAEDGWIDANEG